MGESGLVGQGDADFNLLLPVGGDRPFHDQPAEAEKGPFVDVETGVDGVEGDDRGQDCVIGFDEVARVDHSPADPAGGFCPDLGVVQVRPGQLYRSRGDLHRRFRFAQIPLDPILLFLQKRS